MTETIDTANLRALAEAATPGPWTSVSRGQYWGEDEGEVNDIEGQDVVGAEFVKPIGDVDTTRGQAWRRDTDYIAAANPAVMLALLDRLAAAEARNATLTDDAARYRYLRDETEWEPFESAWLIKHDIYGCPTLAMDVAIDMARAAASISTKGDGPGCTCQGSGGPDYCERHAP